MEALAGRGRLDAGGAAVVGILGAADELELRELRDDSREHRRVKSFARAEVGELDRPLEDDGDEDGDLRRRQSGGRLRGAEPRVTAG